MLTTYIVDKSLKRVEPFPLGIVDVLNGQLLTLLSIGADHVQDHVIAILRALNHLEMVVDIVKIDERGKSNF